MSQDSQIIQALFQIAVQKPFKQVIADFGRPTLSQIHFKLLITKVDPTIQGSECDRFFQKVILEHNSFIGITEEILEELTKNQDRVQVSLSQGDIAVIKDIIKNYQLKKIDVERVFRYFDKNRDLTLQEREIQELVEFFHPQISKPEYDSLKKQFGNFDFTIENLKQLFHNWENIVQNDQQHANQQEIKFTVRQLKDNSQPQQAVEEQRQDAYQQEDKKEEVDFSDFLNVDLNIQGAKELMAKKEELQRSNGVFTDQEFPASVRSLGASKSQFSWKRFSEIYKTNLRMFSIDESSDSRVGLGKWISHRDILQGDLGDCYFLSSISTIACKWPEVIRDIFVTQKSNPYKLYAIKACLDGEWRIVLLDDFIPVNNKGNVAFTRNSGPEMWVSLLEKAWAKMNSNYTDIDGGDPREVIKSFTGGPTWIVMTNVQNFKEELQRCSDMKCVITTGTFGTNQNYRSFGLEPGHAYSLLKVYDLQHPQKGAVTLVKLRNPWGNTEWNGEWSDNSNIWTPQLKEQVKFGKSADDGIFFMELKDFCKYFQAIFVGYFKSDYLYNSIKQVAKKNKTQQYDIDIPNDGEYYFTVHQEAKRRYMENKSIQYDYSYVRITLIKHLPNDQYEVVDTKKQKDIEVHLGNKISKGKYSIQFKISWCVPTWSEHQYVFSVYGSEFVRPKQVLINQEIRRKAFLNYGAKNTNQQQLMAGLFCANECSFQKGFGYFYYKNTTDKSLKVQNTLAGKQGIKFLKPERGDSYIVELPPGKEGIVLFNIDPKGVAFSIQHKLVK